MMRQLPIFALLLVGLSSVGIPASAQYPATRDGGGYPMTFQPPQQPQQQPMQQFAVPPMQPMQQMQSMQQQPGPGLTIAQWFNQYDQVRRQAQMSPVERQRADSLMSRGLSILVPGDTKIATKQILGTMVDRYTRACNQLKGLPQIQPTQQLQVAYYNYFNTAGLLFLDYLRVQDNLLLSDATTGQPLAAGLLQRKQMLEMLEGRCKQLDAQVRAQYGVPPYQY